MEISRVSDFQPAYDSKSVSKPMKKSENDPNESNASEVLVTSTDKVDAEIEKLKAQLEKLKSRADSDPREIASIENQLRQKDNDTYRRQHAEHFSRIDINA